MKRTQKQAFAEHLLNNMTWPERILWSRLRSKQIGYSFQRQAIVLGYVVDFWCPEARVVVELDGATHTTQEAVAYDARRDDQLRRVKVDVLRFENRDVKTGMSAVLIRIWDHCHRNSPHTLKPYLEANPIRSACESLEMRALIQFQDDKRLQEHELAFSNRYWKKRALR